LKTGFIRLAGRLTKETPAAGLSSSEYAFGYCEDQNLEMTFDSGQLASSKLACGIHLAIAGLF
jgi:hypothetical protein